MKKYNNYKNSGVEWLGEIPEHWEALSNKFIFKLNKNLVGKKSSEYDLLSLTLNGVIKRDMENPQGKFPAEFDTYQEVKKGDFIFCLFDVEETPRTVGLSDFDGMITGAYTVMQVNENFDNSFLYYFYFNLDAGKRMKPLYTGLRNTISKDNFFSFKTFVPSINEQTAIAHFLDEKTTKIDQAIAIKQKQIELLKERRQVLIHKAVTRGLDKNVKLKDSGVEWIGEIPEHWEVKKIKHIFEQIKTGTTPITSNPKFYDGEIDWYNPKDLNNEILKYSEKKISQLAINRKEISLFPSDSILIVGIGGTTGKTSYLLNTGTFNQQITGFHSNKQYNKYYLYLFHSLSKVMLNTASYTTLPILNNEFFKSFRLIKPNIDEQKQIVEFIETATTKIATAISLKEQEIEKLKEYKMSLIDGVVSGKMKVF